MNKKETQTLAGKKVVVTGASRGIGKAIAQLCKIEGAFVIGTGTHSVDSGMICDDYFQADFSDIQQIHSCAKYVVDVSPDVLINNAGVNKIAPFAEIRTEDFLRINQVNLIAPFILCQAAIPGMKNRNWGRVVNLTSIWSKVSKEGRASYSSSKFGLDGLTLALALEYAQDNILANCIAPGVTDTEMTRSVLDHDQIESLVSLIPIKRMATMEEIARFVVWLASPNNTYITGQNIAIDGGCTRA
jgi:NAD(P)-dependent dehydrogenase (short-subunit alcohol dehydrogenase family)